MTRLLLTVMTVLVAACAGTQSTSDAGGWLDPWHHNHASPRGTPYIHPFGMEPAFVGRDLLVSYHRHEAPGETEDEVEAELEWALTRRLGVAIELPLARVEESGGPTHEGISDVSIAPRAVLVETADFLLAASAAVALPTGDDKRDLGAGEVLLGPALSTWSDLGSGITLQARIGTEHGLETGNAQLDYYTSLIWTLAEDRRPTEHLPAGMTSLIAEFGGRTILDGPDETRTTAEALLGISYLLNGSWEVRGGFQLPVGGPEDIDRGFVIGSILHF